MRLTYKNKSKKVRDQALAQLRQVRAQFEKEHPELLARIREEVKNQPLYDGLPNMSASEPIERPKEDYLIDRNKNLRTVMALVQNHKASDSFQRELKKILMDVSSDLQ